MEDREEVAPTEARVGLDQSSVPSALSAFMDMETIVSSIAATLTTAHLLGIVGAFVATYLGQALGWYRADEGAGLIGATVASLTASHEPA
jgi:Transglycosylase associated protein